MEPILLIGLALILLSGSNGPGGTSGGADLLRRANGGKASGWVPIFESLGQTYRVAQALARWAGIESSGNPLAKSKLDERGLLQAMKATKIFTDAEWTALSDAATPAQTHAALAIKEARELWTRAAKRIKNQPSDPIEQLFFAKLYHQRPKDFWDVAMHGPATTMAAELAKMWAASPAAMHRLQVASVVAWNNPEPWGANV
jgi:hypothetical protein